MHWMLNLWTPPEEDCDSRGINFHCIQCTLEVVALAPPTAFQNIPKSKCLDLTSRLLISVVNERLIVERRVILLSRASEREKRWRSMIGGRCYR